MKRIYAIALPSLLAALVGGCQTARPTQLPQGAAAYAVVPAADPAAVPAVRTLRSGDTISVQVYREPDLSLEKAVIDDLGKVQLPLLGEVTAAGVTAADLSRTIAERLGARYLRDPRVTVTLVATEASTVTVEGQVVAPGVYEIARNETLLTTIARAKSPTRTARDDEIVVFRTINGQRSGAVFDLGLIRTGRAPDPQILQGDVVVVGFSQVKGAFRDFLTAAPLLNIFTAF